MRRVDRRGPGGVHRGRAAGQDRARPACGRASRRPASCGARSRSRPAPRARGGRSAGRTGHRSRRRGPGRAPLRPWLATWRAAYRRAAADPTPDAPGPGRSGSEAGPWCPGCRSTPGSGRAEGGSSTARPDPLNDAASRVTRGSTASDIRRPRRSAGAAHRARPRGPPGSSARPARSAGTPCRARAAGRPRPCWARTPSPARPGR